MSYEPWMQKMDIFDPPEPILKLKGGLCLRICNCRLGMRKEADDDSSLKHVAFCN